MRFSLFLRTIAASASSSASTENTSNNEATAAKGNSHVNKCTNTYICAMLTSDRKSTRIFLEILNPSLIAYELLLIGISKFSVDPVILSSLYFKLKHKWGLTRVRSLCSLNSHRKPCRIL